MSTKSLRVLHVEDCESDTLLLEFKLEAGGYRSMCCRVDTAAALTAALARQGWDLVISDYHIAPGFDGMDALKLTKAHAPGVPLLILSGVLEEEEAAAVIKAGASDYVLKGDWGRLVPAVERAMRQAEAARASVHDLKPKAADR